MAVDQSRNLVNRRLIVRNTLASLIGTVTITIMGLLVSIVTARYLGPAELGLLSLIQWVRTTANIILDVGLASAVVKFVSEMEGRGEQDSAKSLAVNLLLVQAILATGSGLALAIFAPTIAALLGNGQIAVYLPLVGAALVLSTIDVFLRACLTGHQRFRMRTIIDILSAGLTTTGVFSIITLSLGIASFIQLEILIAGLQFVILIIIFIRSGTLRLPSRPSRERLNSIIRYCSGIFFITTLDAVIWQRSETFFLSRYSQSMQIAFYGLAFNIAALIGTTLPAAIGSVLFPVLSQRFGAGRREDMQLIYETATKLMAGIILPICIGGAAISSAMISLLYGPSYEPASAVFSVLLIGIAAGALTAPNAALLLALGIPAQAVWWMVPIAILNLILAYLLVIPFGALGAAMASSTSQLLGATAGIVYLNRFQGFRFPLGQIIRIAIATLPMGCAAYLVSQQLGGLAGVVFGVVIGAPIYLLAILLIGVVSDLDLSLLGDLNIPGSRLAIIILRDIKKRLRHTTQGIA